MLQCVSCLRMQMHCQMCVFVCVCVNDRVALCWLLSSLVAPLFLLLFVCFKWILALSSWRKLVYYAVHRDLCLILKLCSDNSSPCTTSWLLEVCLAEPWSALNTISTIKRSVALFSTLSNFYYCPSHLWCATRLNLRPTIVLHKNIMANLSLCPNFTCSWINNTSQRQ